MKTMLLYGDVGMDWIGMDWIVLDGIVLDWFWMGLDWNVWSLHREDAGGIFFCSASKKPCNPSLVCLVPPSRGCRWIGLDWIGLDRIGLDWIGLDWIGSDWIGLTTHLPLVWLFGTP
jgi:hypothetical protein